MREAAGRSQMVVNERVVLFTREGDSNATGVREGAAWIEFLCRRVSWERFMRES